MAVKAGDFLCHDRILTPIIAIKIYSVQNSSVNVYQSLLEYSCVNVYQSLLKYTWRSRPNTYTCRNLTSKLIISSCLQQCESRSSLFCCTKTRGTHCEARVMIIQVSRSSWISWHILPGGGGFFFF